jgi:hypothetical protein
MEMGKVDGGGRRLGSRRDVIHVPDPVFLILMLLFLMAVPVFQFLFQ